MLPVDLADELLRLLEVLVRRKVVDQVVSRELLVEVDQKELWTIKQEGH